MLLLKTEMSSFFISLATNAIHRQRQRQMLLLKTEMSSFFISLATNAIHRLRQMACVFVTLALFAFYPVNVEIVERLWSVSA